MASSAILLVEDNPDDEALTLRAFRKNNITNEVVVARDGARSPGLSIRHRRLCQPRSRRPASNRHSRFEAA